MRKKVFLSFLAFVAYISAQQSHISSVQEVFNKTIEQINQQFAAGKDKLLDPSKINQSSITSFKTLIDQFTRRANTERDRFEQEANQIMYDNIGLLDEKLRSDPELQKVLAEYKITEQLIESKIISPLIRNVSLYIGQQVGLFDNLINQLLEDKWITIDSNTVSLRQAAIAEIHDKINSSLYKKEFTEEKSGGFSGMWKNFKQQAGFFVKSVAETLGKELPKQWDNIKTSIIDDLTTSIDTLYKEKSEELRKHIINNINKAIFGPV